MERKHIGGFTLLETLLTVAILVILMGVSAVGVAYYKDYLKVTELDNTARDIYMAAENRAVLLQNSGASVSLLSLGGSGDVALPKTATQLNDLLPKGTIDPVFWEGERDFRVVYDQATGHVKEVFYAEKAIDSALDDLSGMSRADRVNLFRVGKTLVGYYGSDVGSGSSIVTKPLPSPGVEVMIDNGEELTLTVRYTLPEGLPAAMEPPEPTSVKLYYPKNSDDPIVEFPVPVLLFTGNTATYEKVLDSLESGKQFKDLKSGLTDLGGDFTVTAGLTLSATGWIDSAYYAEGTDNSLFAKETHDEGTAYIANLRHLQNLCSAKSTYAYMSTGNTCSDFVSGVGNRIQKAEQIAHIECRQYLGSDYNFSAINNPNLTSYDGKGYELRGLFSENHGGGLFNQTGEAGMIFQHIRLIAPEIRVSHSAGVDPAGLVMMLTKGTNTLDDVWAVNATIYGEGGTDPAAGGLVGIIGGQDYDTTVNIQNCRVFWENEKNDDGTIKPVSQLLTKDGEIDYKITSKFAGGLVGICSSNYDHTYTLNITNSFAATTIKSSHPSGGLNTGAGKNACIGGLVGGTGYHDTTEGTVKVTIKNSYADCYFGEDWNGKPVYIGGLVGSHNSYAGSSGTQNKASLHIENSYAAGFIVNPRDHVKSAGLANDQNPGKITATKCYSVVRVLKADGTLEKPATPMYPGWNESSPGSAFYLSKADEVAGAVETALGAAFESATPETHVYNLRHQLNPTANPTLRLTPPYPFPGLKGTDGTVLPHYGDWAKLEDGKTLIPAGLAYYETYGASKYGAWGVLGNGTKLEDALTETMPVMDGYALVFEGDKPPEGQYRATYERWIEYRSNRWKQDPIEYDLTITADSCIWEWEYEKDDDFEGGSQTVTPLTVTKGSGAEAKTYTLIPLPDEVMTEKLTEYAKTSGKLRSFYRSLKVELLQDDGSTPEPDMERIFFFNPHFAKALVGPTVNADGTITQPKRKYDGSFSKDPTTDANAAVVRTARHLYNLARFPENYVDADTAANAYHYRQELDLDYALYKGYSDFPTGITADNPYIQQSIGIKRTSVNLQFRGTYDGGCYEIRNVVGASDTTRSDAGGLFGMVGVGGTLKNIVYPFNPDHKAVATVVTTGAANERLSYGTLAGWNEGRLYNCAAYGVNLSVTVPPYTDPYGGDDVCYFTGGLVGNNSGSGLGYGLGTQFGTIENCSVELVSLEAANGNVGGLAGGRDANSGTIKGCHAVGRMTTTSGTYHERMVGLSVGGTISDSYAAVRMDWAKGSGSRTQLSPLCGEYATKGNSVAVKGHLYYRGEDYTNNDYDSLSLEDFLRRTNLGPKAEKTVHYDVSGEDWAEDYKEGYPYFTKVVDGEGKPVHYGLWPMARWSGIEFTMFYYEQYGSGDSLERGFYQMTEKDGKLEETVDTLEDTGTVAIDSYVLAAPVEDLKNNWFMYNKIKVTYGENEWILDTYSGGFVGTYTSTVDKYDNDDLHSKTSSKFTAEVNGTKYYMVRLPFEWIDGELAEPGKLYQTLTVVPLKNESSEEEASLKRTFLFNPYLPKTLTCPEQRSTAAPTLEFYQAPTPIDKGGEPVRIRTARQFTKYLGDEKYFCGKYVFRQERDVNASYNLYNYTYYTGYDKTFQLRSTLGTSAKPFNGIYDGQGYKLEAVPMLDNSYMVLKEKSDEYANGLFRFSVGTLKNIVLVKGPTGSPRNYSNSRTYYCGSLVGWNMGTVENCVADLPSFGCGYTYKWESNSSPIWDVDIYGGSLVGGNDRTGTIRNCAVTVESFSFIANFEIASSAWNPPQMYELKLKSLESGKRLGGYTGGLVGRNFGAVEGCSAELQESKLWEQTKVQSSSDSNWKADREWKAYCLHAGGLVGSNEQGGTITSSYAVGLLGNDSLPNYAISERSGFAARNLGAIRDCYTAMRVKYCSWGGSPNRAYYFCNPAQSSAAGSEGSLVTGTFENCFYLGYTSPKWTYSKPHYVDNDYLPQNSLPTGVTAKSYDALAALTGTELPGMGKVEGSDVYPFPVGTKNGEDKWYYFGKYWPVKN